MIEAENIKKGNIRQFEDINENPIFPVTITDAVVDPITGKTIKVTLDENLEEYNNIFENNEGSPSDLPDPEGSRWAKFNHYERLRGDGLKYEEDLIIDTNDEVKLANRDSTDGMGYIILRKNKTFAEQVTKENTIYEIRYNFTLTGDVTIPANCVLEFKGGSISGSYTLIGTNTGINAGLVKIFNTNVILEGSWNIAEIYPEWFGAKKDGFTDDTLSINKTIYFAHNIGGGTIKFSCGTYLIGTFELNDGNNSYSSLRIYSNIKYIGEGATIKVKDGVNRTGFAFNSVFSSVLNTWIQDIEFAGIRFDLNGQNNLYPASTSDLKSCCAIKMFYPNGRIVIRNCEFYNSPGAHFIAPGYVENCLITENTFRNCADSIKGNTIIWDHSSILVAGTNVNITNNTFINDNRSEVATAIEVESNHAVVSGNVVYGYSVGYLIASVGVSKTDSTIFNSNRIYRTRKPIELWNDVSTSGNIIISNNIISQDLHDVGGAIINLYSHVNADVKNILIENNLIYSTVKTNEQETNILMTNGYIHSLVFKNNYIKDVTGGIYILDGSSDILIEDNIFDNVNRNTQTELRGFLIIQPNTSTTNAISKDVVIRRNKIKLYVHSNITSDMIGIWILSKHKSITIEDNKLINVGVPIHTEYADFSEGNDRIINISNTFVKYSNTAPTTGTWTRGNIIFNTAPSANGVFAWSCISSGTPGIWKEVKIEA